MIDKFHMYYNEKYLPFWGPLFRWFPQKEKVGFSTLKPWLLFSAPAYFLLYLRPIFV